MKKTLTALTGLFLLILMWFPCSVNAAEEPISVYDGSTLKKAYTYEDLNDRWRSEGRRTYEYSGYNTYASYKPYPAPISADGPEVIGLLEDAGIDIASISDSDLIGFYGRDGFGMSMTKTQLTSDRFYFPYGENGTEAGKRGDDSSRREATRVPIIIDIDKETNCVLRVGQVAPNEQNWPAHIQYLMGGKITIKRGAAKTLAADLKTSVDTGQYVLPGQQISITGGNHYTKIYYTLNGSEPTIESDIYNYNTYPGSEQNAVIKAPASEGESIVVKCRKIAFGSHDSAVQTFTYTVNSAEVQKIIDSRKPKVVKDKSYTVSSQTYKVTKVAAGTTNGTAIFTKAKNAKGVTVPATVKLADGKTYNVTTVGAKAFTGSKIRTVTIGKNVSKLTKNALYKSKATKVIVKTKKLKKSTVKGSLKGSKVKKVQVKVGTKKQNTTYVKKYKKIFTKKNAGRKVTVTR